MWAVPTFYSVHLFGEVVLNQSSERSLAPTSPDIGSVPRAPTLSKFEETREVLRAVKGIALIDLVPGDGSHISTAHLAPIAAYLASRPKEHIKNLLARVQIAAPKIWPLVATKLQDELILLLSTSDRAAHVPTIVAIFSQLKVLQPQFLDFAERQIALPGTRHNFSSLLRCGESLLASSISDHRIHGTLLRVIGNDEHYVEDRSSEERFRLRSYGSAIPALGSLIVGGLINSTPRTMEELSNRELFDLALALGLMNVRRPDITRAIESRLDSLLTELTPDERAELCYRTNFRQGYTPTNLCRLVGITDNGWSLNVTSLEAHTWILAGMARDSSPLMRTRNYRLSLNDISKNALRHNGENTANRSCKIISALGILRHLDQPLLNKCSERLSAEVKSLDSNQLLPALRGMASVLFHHAEATPAAINQLVAEISTLRPKQQAELMYCMARLNELDSDAGQRVVKTVTEVMSQLPMQDACDVAWSAGVLPSEVGSKLWYSAAKVALKDPRLLSRPNWIAIYEGCLASGLEPPANLERIVAPMLVPRWETILSRSSFERDVAHHLRVMKVQFEEEVWVKPYRIDFMIFKEDGSRELLELDGVQYHYVAGDTTRPFGRHLIKDKVLSNLGHEITHIHSDDWSSGANKQELLRERLKIS